MDIQKSVPVPESIGRKGPPRKYPFESMDTGDSVFFEGAKTGGKEYLAALAHGRYYGKRFSGKAEGSGVRIWRIE